VFVKGTRAALEQRIAELKQKIAVAPEAGKFSLTRKRDDLEREWKSLEGRPDEDYLGRAGCGADLTEQIEAVPADGEVYEYRCPKCGNTGTTRKAAPAPA
jgi:hypothetical protein